MSNEPNTKATASSSSSLASSSKSVSSFNISVPTWAFGQSYKPRPKHPEFVSSSEPSLAPMVRTPRKPGAGWRHFVHSPRLEHVRRVELPTRENLFINQPKDVEVDTKTINAFPEQKDPSTVLYHQAIRRGGEERRVNAITSRDGLHARLLFIDKNVTKFRYSDLLGQGSYGVARRVADPRTGKTYAIKEWKVRNRSKDVAQKEQRLKYDNIVDFKRHEQNDELDLERIVMRNYEGDLFSLTSDASLGIGIREPVGEAWCINRPVDKDTWTTRIDFDKEGTIHSAGGGGTSSCCIVRKPGILFLDIIWDNGIRRRRQQAFGHSTSKSRH
ncbi:hypothetical protein B0T26DRAFT_670453 [Lasiosphaeria miniovina]|uniref:Protein kinase domain-containing protein n=1 Tax=Lasiosphaeria miniovina TaxID=1954250 RepID=A0AA40EBQ5_9PEZI|nr:uncharacterized protein B0T26DRAFT_670453 [Lasiosphaeria miniovina]KAK0734120.1 hypothetical protein B0T26DRAFT_670453 [Lasiosphaeria miniovina]